MIIQIIRYGIPIEINLEEVIKREIIKSDEKWRPLLEKMLEAIKKRSRCLEIYDRTFPLRRYEVYVSRGGKVLVGESLEAEIGRIKIKGQTYKVGIILRDIPGYEREISLYFEKA